jgi:hypothetical protein
MRRTHIVLFAAFALICVICIALATSSSGPKSEPTIGNPVVSTAASAPQSVEVSEPQAPPSSGLTVHPYELLKNPYKAKGKLVFLDLNSRPVLWSGSVVQYSGPIEPTFGIRLGLMALRLNRMLAEDVALYDIMGVEAGASDGEMLGQLAVSLPSGVNDLNLGRSWAVEPLGTLSGTNAFGGEITIPSVKFWHYREGHETPTQSPPAQIVQPQQTQETPARPQASPQTEGGGVIGTFSSSSPK